MLCTDNWLLLGNKPFTLFGTLSSWTGGNVSHKCNFGCISVYGQGTTHVRNIWSLLLTNSIEVLLKFRRPVGNLWLILNVFIVFSTWPLGMIEQNQDIVEWCGRIGRRQRDNSACAGSPLFAYRAPWRHGRNNERQTTGGVFVKCIVWICSKVKWYNVKPLRITAGSQYRAHIDSWVCAQEIMGTGTI